MLEIITLATDVPFREKGLSSALLFRVKVKAYHRKVKAIFVNAGHDTVEWYEKRRFVPLDEKDERFKDVKLNISKASRTTLMYWLNPVYEFPPADPEREMILTRLLPTAEYLRMCAKPSVLTVAPKDLQDWEPKLAIKHATLLENLVTTFDKIIQAPHRTKDVYKDGIMSSRIPFIRIQFTSHNGLYAGEIVKLDEILDHGWIGSDHKNQVEVYKVKINDNDFAKIQEKSTLKVNSFLVRSDDITISIAG